MFEIQLDVKDFLLVIESISKVFLELPIEVNDEGFRVRNVSNNKEAAITINADKEDMKEFKYDNKNPVFMTLPFGEFLDAIKKIKTPISIGEEGKAQLYIKGDKITYKIDKRVDDPDLYTNHDAITKLHNKVDAEELVINSGDFINAVDSLYFSASGVKMRVNEKKLTFESLKGGLTGIYEIDVDVDKDFKWEGAYNTEYMKVLKSIAAYSKELKFFVKNVEDEDDPIPPTIVELIIAPNSDVSFIMACQKDEDTVSSVSQTDDDDDDTTTTDDDNLDFENDDFYENDSEE